MRKISDWDENDPVYIIRWAEGGQRFSLEVRFFNFMPLLDLFRKGKWPMEVIQNLDRHRRTLLNVRYMVTFAAPENKGFVKEGRVFEIVDEHSICFGEEVPTTLLFDTLNEKVSKEEGPDAPWWGSSVDHLEQMKDELMESIR